MAGFHCRLERRAAGASRAALTGSEIVVKALDSLNAVNRQLGRIDKTIAAFRTEALRDARADPTRDNLLAIRHGIRLLVDAGASVAASVARNADFASRALPADKSRAVLQRLARIAKHAERQQATVQAVIAEVEAIEAAAGRSDSQASQTQ